MVKNFSQQPNAVGTWTIFSSFVLGFWSLAFLSVAVHIYSYFFNFSVLKKSIGILASDRGAARSVWEACSCAKDCESCASLREGGVKIFGILASHREVVWSSHCGALGRLVVVRTTQRTGQGDASVKLVS